MIRKMLFSAGAALLLTVAAQAQSRYFTKTAKAEFFSKASMEDIQAVNKAATLVLDTKTGALQVAMLMKGFEFEKALMQEHFNENYVESDKFPKAEFRGSILNNSDIDYTKPGTYTARVKGKLTLHGVTRDVETTGNITVEKDAVRAVSAFSIQLSDYGVAIPAVVKDKVSNAIKITIDSKLDPLKG